MLKLFRSIFDEEKRRRHPESFIKAVIERAIDCTDPRMRILPGYARTLRKPALHSLEHIMSLVENLPAPLLATKAGYTNSPLLGTIFISPARMYEIFNNDKTLCDYLAEMPKTSDQVTGLLVVQRHEKQGFGYGLIDGKLVNDVQQTTVSFGQHRLLDLAVSEEETRRLLKRRAFDYLLSIALNHVSEQHHEREKLSQQCALLRVKLGILQKGGGSFSHDAGTQDHIALQARLEEVESQLHALGPAQEVLQENLRIVASTLENAEKHFWSEEKILRLDQHGILCPESGTAAIPCHDLCDSNGHRITTLLLTLLPGELPQRPDLASFLKAHG